MLFDKSAVTTIQERSFAGLVVAHLALTAVVCGGLLLLPATASSEGLPTTVSAIPAHECDAAVDPAGDHQLTGGDAELSAPDSDDDDRDDAATGSDAAIAADECRTVGRNELVHVVDVEVKRWISRTVEGHSLRSPPEDDSSSDADDIDGDDDDPTAECSYLLPPATSRAAAFLTPAEFVSASSTRSRVLSLRAPPL